MHGSTDAHGKQGCRRRGGNSESGPAFLPGLPEAAGPAGHAARRGGTEPRYPRPAVHRDPALQIAVLNLPRGYDWVKLLVPAAQQSIGDIRANLEARHGLALPTSTPDIAVVVLPERERGEPSWRRELPNLTTPNRSCCATHSIVWRAGSNPAS